MCRLQNDISPDPSSTSAVRVHVIVAELMPPNDEEPEIIAIAKWKFVKEALPVEVWRDSKQHEMTQEELGEGANLELLRTFLGRMHQFQREAMRGDRCLREFDSINTFTT